MDAAPTPGVGHAPHPRAHSVGGDYGAEVIQSVAFADWVNEGGRHARSLHVERLLLDWRICSSLGIPNSRHSLLCEYGSSILC